VEDVEERSRRDAEAQAAVEQAAEEQVAEARRALEEGKRRRAEQDATALAEQAAAGQEMRRARAVGTIVGICAKLERWPQWRAMRWSFGRWRAWRPVRTGEAAGAVAGAGARATAAAGATGGATETAAAKARGRLSLEAAAEGQRRALQEPAQGHDEPWRGDLTHRNLAGSAGEADLDAELERAGWSISHEARRAHESGKWSAESVAHCQGLGEEVAAWASRNQRSHKLRTWARQALKAIVQEAADGRRDARATRDMLAALGIDAGGGRQWGRRRRPLWFVLSESELRGKTGCHAGLRSEECRR
jgi:hypothetical protein